MQRGIVALGLALVAFTGGCVADSGDGGILVLKNVVADAMCTTKGDNTELARTHGSLDLLFPTGYLFIAQMKSKITALAGQEDQRTIITTGAKVDIAFPGSQLFSAEELAELSDMGLTRFKSPFSQAIFPNGGLSDAGFVLIPAQLTQRIATKIGPTSSSRVEAIATFTIEGDMAGATVTSQPFSYPITLGNGVALNVITTCPLPRGSAMPRTGYACNLAQDGVVDCCASRFSDGSINPATLQCPAPVATM